jgi:cleavage and polyadenylation specificity factor subunit 3
MLDCGIHPGYSGMKSLPYLDEVDLSKVDVALITHFHLDHCAAVPHLVGNTDFKVYTMRCQPDMLAVPSIRIHLFPLIIPSISNTC